MKNYAIFMLIFGAVLCLAGISIYRGNDWIIARGYYEKASPAYLKFVGTIIMCISLAPVLSALTALVLKEESITPGIVLIITGIAGLIIPLKFLKEDYFEKK